jgi:hypothetical protein
MSSIAQTLAFAPPTMKVHGEHTSDSRRIMNKLKYLALVIAVAGISLTVSAPKANAQVSQVDGRSLDERGNNIGGAPTCPYGYYDYAPYSCAPYGYYGSEWFNGGSFIGAGQWFHGPANFSGRVNNRFHPDHGYKGPMPNVGDKPDPSKRLGKISNFKENEMRDGRGNVTKAKR